MLHTHKSQINTNPVTGVTSTKRIDKPTDAVDIDYADESIKEENLRIRENRNDVGGY